MSSQLDIASVRTLRMALGTALSLWFSQVGNWDMSFIAAVLTMFVLSLPLPAPKLAGGIKFILALALSVYAGLALLPLILNQRAVGVLLLTLALFGSFYYSARGGSAVIGAFSTVGLAVAAAVGSVTIDGALAAAKGVSIGAVFGIAFVWVAHALIPDSLAGAPAGPAPVRPPPAPPDAAVARQNALRSLFIVLPVLLWLLLSSSSASYVAVMIKVASMGQQASADRTRQVGKSLLLSTLIGGVAAIIGWEVLSVWPSLTMYTLLVGLAGLVMGKRIFAGAGMHAAGGTWSYGYLTLLIVLAPAVLDSQSGGTADMAFWSRLLMFVWATVYAIAAVYVFDAFWPSRKAGPDAAAVGVKDPA